MADITSAASAADRGGPDWLVERRRDATRRAEQLPMPSADDEVWRYSPIDDLDLDEFTPTVVTAGADAPVPAQLEGVSTVRLDGGALVTGGAPLPDGVHVRTAADLDTAPGLVETHEPDRFAELAVAWADPIVIDIEAGVTVDHPIVVRTTGGAAATATFTHLIVRLGDGADAVVAEWRTSSDDEQVLVPRVDLVVGERGSLGYLDIQQLGSSTWQLGRQFSSVAAGGSIHASVATFGGSYARLRADCRLAGEGATAKLQAGYFADGDQTLDFRTFQEHDAPHTASDLLFVGAGAGSSRSVYTGTIRVAKGAKGTDAVQTNRNVKLSDDAWAESVPNLEILNNEVQCSHASSVGPVDEDQRFYLEARGVPPEVAERLIVAGFFEAVVAELPVPGFADLVRARSPTSSPGRPRHDPNPRLLLDEFEAGTARRIDVDGEPVAVVRCGDELFAIDDTCTHADYSLSEGEVDCDEVTIECWKHGSAFSLRDGVPLSLPATQPTSVHDTEVADGDVYVTIRRTEA